MESMKLIDFQIMTEANPVRDLSHFIYSGHSKEQLDKFEDYLKVYYTSLSTNLRELGSDPEKLYPFGQLFTDWSKHALFGLFFSLMVAKVKLIENNDMQDIVKDDTDADMMSGMLNAKVNIDLYNERTRNIVLHAEKYNAI